MNINICNMKKKKSKPSEQAPPADFKNNPFKSLKGVVAKPGPAQQKTALRREEKPASAEDEAALFLRAMGGARKIEGADASAAVPRKQQTPKTSDAGSQEDEDVFLQAMLKIGADFREASPEPDAEAPEHRSQTSRMRQLKRGAIRISQELDLHGYLKEDAVTRLAHFVVNAFELGQSAVLVITGKGTNSPEGPVLQGAVAAWLRERGKGMVAEFASAPRDKGGSGAFVVFLKRK
jgi:DNA-nicking Smr family endonuclease